MVIVRYVDSLEAITPGAKIPGSIFILQTGEVVKYYGGGTDGELGGFFDLFKTIATIAAPITGAIPGKVGQYVSQGLAAVAAIPNSPSGQYKGLDGINSAVQQVLSGLEQLKQIASAGQFNTASEVVTQANQFADILSDSKKVYQAKNGNDAAALRNGKTAAAAKVQEITQIAQGIESQRLAAIQQQQQAQQAQTETAAKIQSYMPLILIGGGAGLLILILLLK